LLALVRGDVGQHAARLLAAKKPFRAPLPIEAMRPETGHVDDAADSAGRDKLARLDR
jgi:hypothetical protein